MLGSVGLHGCCTATSMQGPVTGSNCAAQQSPSHPRALRTPLHHHQTYSQPHKPPPTAPINPDPGPCKPLSASGGTPSVALGVETDPVSRGVLTDETHHMPVPRPVGSHICTAQPSHDAPPHTNPPPCRNHCQPPPPPHTQWHCVARCFDMIAPSFCTALIHCVLKMHALAPPTADSNPSLPHPKPNPPASCPPSPRSTHSRQRGGPPATGPLRPQR